MANRLQRNQTAQLARGSIPERADASIGDVRPNANCNWSEVNAGPENRRAGLKRRSEDRVSGNYWICTPGQVSQLAENDFDNRISAGHAAFINSSSYTRFGYSSSWNAHTVSSF
jgi:hypothetical protein